MPFKYVVMPLVCLSLCMCVVWVSFLRFGLNIAENNYPFHELFFSIEDHNALLTNRC